MNDALRSSRLRGYLSVAMFVGVLMAPSAGFAIGVLAAGTLVFAAPVLRGWRARLAARSARAVPAGTIAVGADPAGRQVVVSDQQLAAHGLIVGAAGAGKSTTLLTILCGQIRRGRPVIALDMKGSPGFAEQLAAAAAAAGKRMLVWTPEGPGHWNPLAHGNPTALKDMLISSERFTEPHYARAAERYLQTAFQVLAAAHPGRAPQLHEVVALMEPRRLRTVLRGVPESMAERVQDYLGALTPDQLSGVRGVGTRLALLSESCAGPYLATGGPGSGPEIDLRAALANDDVILFSLNSSVYGKLAAQLGALFIQNLVSASGHRTGDRSRAGVPVTIGIDEFSALDADNLLALLARGREAEYPTLLATQEMTDLDRVAHGFRDQVLGIVGMKIVHRQDVPASAEMVARMIGTEKVWERTWQIGNLLAPASASRGTRRQVERYIVHPNEIMSLPTGEAILLTKLPTTAVTRVRVTPPPAGPGLPPPAGPGLPPPTPPAPPAPTVPRPARPGPVSPTPRGPASAALGGPASPAPRGPATPRRPPADRGAER